jgi:hypothetical protein
MALTGAEQVTRVPGHRRRISHKMGCSGVPLMRPTCNLHFAILNLQSGGGPRPPSPPLGCREPLLVQSIERSVIGRHPVNQPGWRSVADRSGRGQEHGRGALLPSRFTLYVSRGGVLDGGVRMWADTPLLHHSNTPPLRLEKTRRVLSIRRRFVRLACERRPSQPAGSLSFPLVGARIGRFSGACEESHSGRIGGVTQSL